jgi:hypothetical protein
MWRARRQVLDWPAAHGCSPPGARRARYAPLDRVPPLRVLLAGVLCFLCTAWGCKAGEGAAMRIEFSTEGGIAYFPGLSQPVSIDSEQLSQQEGAELKRLVEAAHFFDLPAKVGRPAPGAADYRQYNVTIEAGQRRHTLHATEPIEDAELRRLIAFLSAKANEIRRAAGKPSLG